MSHQIRCETCNEIIGNVEKAQITEDDRALYRDTVTCSNGHTNSVVID